MLKQYRHNQFFDRSGFLTRKKRKDNCTVSETTGKTKDKLNQENTKRTNVSKKNWRKCKSSKQKNLNLSMQQWTVFDR